MDGPRLLLPLVIFALVGCHGATPKPMTKAPQAAQAEKPPEKTEPAAAAPAPAPAPPGKEAQPARDDQPVVVDPGGEGAPPGLVETARAERERRANAGKPVAVITDKTLPKYASKGQITIADPKEKEKKKAAVSAGTPVATGPSGEIRDEAYWRGRARDIRERWRDAAGDVKELEQRSAELRQKFYLENDTFTRDNQIKPEWDRVLERLRQARLDVEATKKELDEFLEEGRAADVTPGWLREGEEEEPEEPAAKKEARPAAQSIEPPVIEPAATDPPPFPGALR